MRNKKAIIIISSIVVSLVVIIIGSLLFFISKKDKNDYADPISTIPNPIDNPYTVEPSKFETTISENEFNFPKTLPIFGSSVNNPLTENEAGIVAKRFDFNSKPEIDEDIFDGRTYFWSKDNISLLAYSNSRTYSYRSNESPNNEGLVNKQLTDADIIASSYKFAEEKFGVKKDEFELFSLKYFCTGGSPEGYHECERQKANFFSINYVTKISDYPLLSWNVDESPLSIRMLANGNVYKAKFNYLPLIQELPEKILIKDYQKLISDLDKSTIISLDEGNYYIPQISLEDIDKVTIDNISIFYLIDNNNPKLYQPMFLLTGTAKIKDYTYDPSIKLYLPAAYDN